MTCLLRFAVVVVSLSACYPVSASSAEKEVFHLPDSLLLFSRPYYDLRLVGDGGQRVLLPPASNRVRFSYPALSSRTGAVAWGVFAPSDPTANLPPRYALGISAPRTTKWETYGSFVDLGAATFSPDDSQVAVEAERSRGIGELLILDRGTGEFRPVAGIKSPAATGTIAWSSDGRSLVFEEEFEKNSEVWTIDLRNGVLQKIGAGFNPSWSPDGKWIAYFTEDGQKCILAHPDGTGAHVLKDLGNRFFGYRRFGYAAVWSPDSTRLLLNEMKGDGDYIDVVLVDVQSHRAVRKSKNGWPVFGWANPPK